MSFAYFTDANAKRPSAVKLEPLVEGFVFKILREMIKEPGLEKQKCVSAILKFEGTDGDNTEWCAFLEIMSRPFLSSLGKPTKLLPTVWRAAIIFKQNIE